MVKLNCIHYMYHFVVISRESFVIGLDCLQQLLFEQIHFLSLLLLLLFCLLVGIMSSVNQFHDLQHLRSVQQSHHAMHKWHNRCRHPACEFCVFG